MHYMIKHERQRLKSSVLVRCLFKLEFIFVSFWLSFYHETDHGIFEDYDPNGNRKLIGAIYEVMRR